MKYKVDCKYCGEETERDHNVKTSTCFDCKIINNKKTRANKLKK